MKTFGTRKNHVASTRAVAPFWQVIEVGVLAGMRTFSAPVTVNAILQNHPSKQLAESPLNFLQSGRVGSAFRVLAALELVGDKLPDIPNRTSAPGLIGRCLSGALAGAGLYKHPAITALPAHWPGHVLHSHLRLGAFTCGDFRGIKQVLPIRL
ncbi:hypothetical protein [Mucilaginibacter sp. L3T2-6]|uniref:hypothetical protein n=1 Tax=Mucilaginibacter sp. L3T2-6 TaxID=3062491 RepID=UPI0026775A28|nr:hypothetical protein [Mucilaginibacter sp. L3T2-6]MDO3643040.1 hypothetical protein [Mucilaginibacter sp. L3T2-6]MDV6215807.1 hypothetical protein [Mucilaginibacter sp. L3T2-6]